VQIADAPGRGEPGSGQLDLDRYLADLAGRGYRDWVSLEYKPTSTTEASLAWLPRERRAASARVSAAGGTEAGASAGHGAAGAGAGTDGKEGS
jgi:sugar phosphate isomerase/epimerase